MPIASRKTTQEMPDTTVAQDGAAAALLDRLAVLGVSVRSDGGALRLAPVSLLPADLLAEVRTHKAALLALLTAPVDTLPAPWPDEGDAGIPRRYPNAVAGLLRASLCRPVSWADAAARPSPGSWCRNCEYSRWWGDASGWRCWVCHPPGGLALRTFEEVRT
jgi:hypothetical protein